jgi:ferredoxin-type protein NapH
MARIQPLRQIYRIRYQLSFAVFANSYFLSFLKFFPCPVFNCYACPWAVFACPIGTLQHFAAIGAVPLFTIGVLGFVGSAIGRWTCGWLCPFGLLQDLLAKVPLPKFSIPEKFNYMRYVILVVLVFILPLWLKEPWFSKLCPQGTLEGAIPVVLMMGRFQENIGWLFYTKIAILLVFLGLMLVTVRPFCRTTCPLGTILSFFNGVSFYKLRINKELCNKCGECEKICPVEIKKIYENPDASQCIRCLLCLECEHITWGSDKAPKLVERP